VETAQLHADEVDTASHRAPTVVIARPHADVATGGEPRIGNSVDPATADIEDVQDDSGRPPELEVDEGLAS
jgi:hypothetical protein